MAEILPSRQILTEQLDTRQKEARQGWTSLMEAIETDIEEHEFPYAMPVGKNTKNFDPALVFVAPILKSVQPPSTYSYTVRALTPDGVFRYTTTDETRKKLLSAGKNMDSILIDWLDNPVIEQISTYGVNKNSKKLIINFKDVGELELYRKEKRYDDSLEQIISESKQRAATEGKVAKDVKERKEMQAKIGKLDSDIKCAQEATVFVARNNT